jgi:hypothetical protein
MTSSRHDRVENLFNFTHKYSLYGLGGTEWPDDATFDRGHISFPTTLILKILFISNTLRVHQVVAAFGKSTIYLSPIIHIITSLKS